MKSIIRYKSNTRIKNIGFIELDTCEYTLKLHIFRQSPHKDRKRRIKLYNDIIERVKKDYLLIEGDNQ